MMIFYRTIILLLASSHAAVIHAQFVQIPSGTENELMSIQILDENIYILGKEYLVKSSDEGENLQSIDIPFYDRYTSLNVVNEDELYFIGRDPAGSSSLMRSTDDGLNWFEILYDDWQIHDADVTEEGKIIALTEFGTVNYSNDNGENWALSQAEGITIVFVCEFNLNNDFLIGGYEHISISQNNGNSWLVPNFFTGDCHSIIPMSGEMYYFSNYRESAGSYLSSFERIDYELFDSLQYTEFEIYFQLGIRVFDMAFIDENIGYAVGYDYIEEDGVVLSTQDAGTTWHTVYTGYDHILRDIEIYNDSIAFIVGYDGIILKTDLNQLNYLGIEEEELKGSYGISLYPNPSSHQISIELDNSAELVQFYSATGALVKSSSTRGVSGLLEIDIQELAEGVYTVRYGGRSERLLIKR
jgi:photosystem II stability/assembly factor-like uncharacterized protein